MTEDKFVVDLIKSDAIRLELHLNLCSEVLVMDEDQVVRGFERESFCLEDLPREVDEDKLFLVEDPSVILPDELHSLVPMADNVSSRPHHQGQAQGDVEIVPAVDD